MSAKHLAQGLASLGRNGDSVLVHMQPHEVAGLDALARSQGTKLTYNPDTGMPEAFNLGGFFSSLLPTIVGAGVSMIPGMQFASYPMLSGMLAGAATGALTNRKNPLMGAVMGGMGGYGGANLAKSAMGATADQMIKSGVEPSIGAVQSGFNAIPTNIGANMSNPTAGFVGSTGEMGVNMGATNMANPITAGVNTNPSLTNVNPALQSQIRPDLMSAPTAPSAFDGFSSNLSKAAENVANDPMKFLKENKMNLAGTLGGAALSGLEPTDIYGRPLKGPLDKYDPYATLNLAGDTGLRLYAEGGSITTGGIRDLYGQPDDQTNGAVLSRDGYGLGRLQKMYDGGMSGYKKGGYLDGPGDGMSDSIPATIQGRQPARLADGEFVVPADVVSHIGNGSSKAGAKQLYSMMDRVRKARTGTKKQGKRINAVKHLPA